MVAESSALDCKGRGQPTVGQVLGQVVVLAVLQRYLFHPFYVTSTYSLPLGYFGAWHILWGTTGTPLLSWPH